MGILARIQKRAIDRVISVTDERTVYVLDGEDYVSFTALVHLGIQDELEMTLGAMMPRERYSIQTTAERLGDITIAARQKLWLANSVSDPAQTDAIELEVLNLSTLDGWIAATCIRIV